MHSVLQNGTNVTFLTFCTTSIFDKRENVNSVNFLVSDHPWCTTKWSLTGGGRLWEKSRKKTQTKLINVITQSYNLTSKNEANRELLIMFSSNSAWNWWNFVRNMIMHGCDNPLFYLQIVLQTSFFQVNCFNMSANVVSTIQKWSFVTFEQRFCYNHTWSCPVVAYRKQKTKEYVKFLAQKVVAVVQEIYVVVAYERVFETVFETNKTVIWKVVAYGRWSLMRSGRYESCFVTRET